jgi:hypothetical protein
VVPGRTGVTVIPRDEIENLSRFAKSFQRKFTEGLSLHVGPNRGIHFAVDQNLASLRPLAQSGCEIYDRADRRILEPAFKADPPERSIAFRCRNRGGCRAGATVEPVR